MKSRWLKASSMLWLIFVMPALGLLPLLLLAGLISPCGDVGRYAAEDYYLKLGWEAVERMNYYGEGITIMRLDLRRGEA